MRRLSHPGLGVLAGPAPRRPAPGGGLAVLVVVTVLAALAAPHDQALRGLVTDALPAIARPSALVPCRPRVRGQLGRWPSPWPSGASRTAGAAKAPVGSTARG
jgi:hypothetical protein